MYDTLTGNIILRRTQATEIGDAAIVSGKIADGAVLSGSIASGQIGPNHFSSGAVGEAVIANGSVTSAKVAGAALATPHFANQGILSASIGVAIIGGPHLAGGAIISALIAANVLATPHFANQGILSASFGAAIIGTPHIATGGILSGLIGSGQIGETHIADGVLPTFVAEGRPFNSGILLLSLPGVQAGNSSTEGQPANTDRYYPIIANTKLFVDQIACEVVASGNSGAARMNIYEADMDWQPLGSGSPLLPDVTFNPQLAGLKTVVVSNQPLSAGRYLLAINTDGSVGTLRSQIAQGGPQGYAAALGGNTCVSRLSVARANAAFPTPGTKWNTVTYNGTGFNYGVYLRVLSG